MKGSAGKQSRQTSALERRKKELAYWRNELKNSSQKGLPETIIKEAKELFERKIKIAISDISNLEKKVGKQIN